jgi:hypothetical protein
MTTTEPLATTEPLSNRDLLFLGLSGGLWWIKLTWQLWRRTIYLQEALRREQQKRIVEANAMQKRLLEIFLRGPKPTLRELVDDTVTPYETRP